VKSLFELVIPSCLVVEPAGCFSGAPCVLTSFALLGDMIGCAVVVGGALLGGMDGRLVSVGGASLLIVSRMDESKDA
jgi:hypothetical protein